MFHEFQQLKWVTTPKGEGVLWAFLDYGFEADALFLVCLENGQLWWFPQSDIRAHTNHSLWRNKPEKLGQKLDKNSKETVGKVCKNCGQKTDTILGEYCYHCVDRL